MKIKHPYLYIVVPCWIIVVSVVLGGMAYSPAPNPLSIAQNELNAQGFQIVSATIDSPAIDINVNSTATLIHYAQATNTTVVYNTNQGLVVFDAKNNIGYFYMPLPFGAWFGVPVTVEVALLLMVF